jgi:hypothetical protein
MVDVNKEKSKPIRIGFCQLPTYIETHETRQTEHKFMAEEEEEEDEKEDPPNGNAQEMPSLSSVTGNRPTQDSTSSTNKAQEKAWERAEPIPNTSDASAAAGDGEKSGLYPAASAAASVPTRLSRDKPTSHDALGFRAYAKAIARFLPRTPSSTRHTLSPLRRRNALHSSAPT